MSRPDKRGSVVELDFNLANNEGANFYSRPDGDTDFKFLARLVMELTRPTRITLLSHTRRDY